MADLFGEVTEAELYDAAIHQPFERKVDNAVGLLKKLGAGGVVCFSGGKDSIVLKDIARRAGIQHSVVYSVTTIDPPELIHFIKDYHRDVAWVRQPEHMLQYMVNHRKGLPNRWCRWCCDIYKENTGNGKVKIIGVRAEESVRRKGLWKEVNANRRCGGGIILAPLVYWIDEDIWRYIRENNMPYCCLYDEGFPRIGCVGCPLAGAKKQRRDFDRWPGFERLWHRRAVEMWERWHNAPSRTGNPSSLLRWKSGEEYWAWFVSGKAAERNKDAEAQTLDLFGELPCDNDCQSRFANI